MQVQGDAGLHVDQRDVVGQHVVQLLGQHQPLLADASTLLVLGHPLPLGGLRPADADELGDRQQHASHPATSAKCTNPTVVAAVGSTSAGDDEADVAGRGQDRRPPALAGLHGDRTSATPR